MPELHRVCVLRRRSDRGWRDHDRCRLLRSAYQLWRRHLAVDHIVSCTHLRRNVCGFFRVHLLRRRSERHRWDECNDGLDQLRMVRADFFFRHRHWQKTTAYPQGIQFPVCTPTATEFYCFGGFNANYTGVDNVYYASFTSSGLGQWKSTTSYPLPLQGEDCIADSGDMVCVGGSPNGNGTATQAVYYAPITATGLGSWQQGQTIPSPSTLTCLRVREHLLHRRTFQSI